VGKKWHGRGNGNSNGPQTKRQTTIHTQNRNGEQLSPKVIVSLTAPQHKTASQQQQQQWQQ